jgi:hypothetical protein
VRLLSSLFSLVAAGCVDPHARYEDFLERTAGMRGQDAGMVTPSDRLDFSGRYLAALATTLAPGQPILFSCEVTVSEDLATVDLSFQPLSTDADPLPREPVGESFGASAVAYGEDGSFSAELGELTIPGRANPISGSDIVATVTIAATAYAMTADLPMSFCGGVSGMVSVPLALDLAGSTIGGVEGSDLAGVTPLAACPTE